VAAGVPFGSTAMRVPCTVPVKVFTALTVADATVAVNGPLTACAYGIAHVATSSVPQQQASPLQYPPGQHP
jgi:hypothetical protein